MSSLTKKIPTVVLFTPGLACDGWFYDRTIEKLKKNTNKVIEYTYYGEEDLDMKDFDVKYNFFCGVNKGYYSKNGELYNAFDKRISTIVTLATANPDKAILVRLTLQTYPSFSNSSISYQRYDSITNQKAKLCYIIDRIKSKDKKIHIILVGHSQGGLVNLEAAISKTKDIYKVIAISTPFSGVAVAGFFSAAFRIGEALRTKTGKEVFYPVGNIELNNENYRQRVKDLANDAYFNDLHKRWKSLESRPKTLVLTGTSGHIITRIPGLLNMKLAFDGLVRTTEQKALSNATVVNLSEAPLYCICEKGIMNENCFEVAIGFTYTPCNHECPLPYISIEDALYDTVFNTIIKALCSNNLQFIKDDLDINTCGIANAICAALSDNGDYDPAFKKYYDIYHSPYSHNNLPQCDEVIGRLISEITNY